MSKAGESILRGARQALAFAEGKKEHGCIVHIPDEINVRRIRKKIGLRARERITPHFRLPSSGHLEPIFTRTILNVGFATPAVVLPQIDSIWPKSGLEFWELFFREP